MTLIFFDCETTGLTKSEQAPIAVQPYITELCMIKTDEKLNIIDKYNQMFKVPIDVEVVQPGDKKSTFEITGISNAMLSDKNPFAAHWREISEFCIGTTTMIAHNVKYDIACLKYALMRLDKLLNFPWATEHQCTVEMSMHITNYRMNLNKLFNHFYGRDFSGAHRAEEDVLAVIACYAKLKGIELEKEHPALCLI